LAKSYQDRQLDRVVDDGRPLHFYIPVINPPYINDNQIEKLNINNENISSRHIYVIYVSEEIHRRVFEDLREAGIGVNLHYIPVHLQPYYQRQGFKKGDYPSAELHAKKAISLPIYPNLTFKEQDYIIDTMDKIIKNNHNK